MPLKRITKAVALQITSVSINTPSDCTRPCLAGVFPHLDPQTAALLAFLGVLGGALGFFLWTFALTRLTSTQVAVYINLSSLVAMVLAAALLAERLTIAFAAGFGVVLVGVLPVNWPKRTGAAPLGRSR